MTGSPGTVVAMLMIMPTALMAARLERSWPGCIGSLSSSQPASRPPSPLCTTTDPMPMMPQMKSHGPRLTLPVREVGGMHPRRGKQTEDARSQRDPRG